MLIVKDLIALYLRHTEAEGLHCREVAAVRKRSLSDFVEVYGHLPAEKCEADHLTDWVDAHPSWRSDSTRRAQSSAVRACFKWAADLGKIKCNPFREVRYCRDAERRPRLPDDVFEKIARAADQPFERAFRWLRFTGCRPSEMCRAKWEDVDLELRVWKIPSPKCKFYKPKIVPLTPEAVAMLRSMNGAGGVIFLTARGRPWRRLSLARRFRRVKQRCGVQTSATLRSIGRRFATAVGVGPTPVNPTVSQPGFLKPSNPRRHYPDFNGSTY